MVDGEKIRKAKEEEGGTKIKSPLNPDGLADICKFFCTCDGARLVLKN
jgi:hypothetical protein